VAGVVKHVYNFWLAEIKCACEKRLPNLLSKCPEGFCRCLRHVEAIWSAAGAEKQMNFVLSAECKGYLAAEMSV
jgi:hypothetical protein